MNERIYIKLKINPTENLEEHINNLLRTTFFPRYKFQLSYLAKFSKIGNGEEEVYNRSNLYYNYLDQGVHNIIMQKLDDEQLEGSSFVLNGIVNVILEIYKVNDVQASSYIELAPKLKENQSVINIKNKDQFCFLWNTLAYLYPVEVNKNKTPSYSIHFNKINLEGLDFPMKVKHSQV